MLKFDNESKKITMIVKDTGSLTVNVENYVLNEGDEVVFTVNKVREDEHPLIQKRVQVFEDGKAIIQYQKSRSKTVAKSTGFEAFLETDNRCYLAYFAADYCANSTLFEWGLPEEDQQKYDIFVLCRPVIGENRSYISIISNREDISAAEICKKYGGGGHVKIAGCVVNIEKHYIREDDEYRVFFKEYEPPREKTN
jgi:nanoRNase/pAp phosphatase (c-di-AMP/oligoRNAs hydrolase)